DGADQVLAAAIVQLAAQTADLDVDGAIERLRIRTAGELQQLVAGKYALRPLDEGAQQRELAGRQVHHHALGGTQLATHQVEAPSGELAASADPGVLPAMLGPAQHGPDARQKLTRIA